MSRIPPYDTKIKNSCINSWNFEKSVTQGYQESKIFIVHCITQNELNKMNQLTRKLNNGQSKFSNTLQKKEFLYTLMKFQKSVTQGRKNLKFASLTYQPNGKMSTDLKTWQWTSPTLLHNRHIKNSQINPSNMK